MNQFLCYRVSSDATFLCGTILTRYLNITYCLLNNNDLFGQCYSLRMVQYATGVRKMHVTPTHVHTHIYGIQRLKETLLDVERKDFT